MGGLGPGIGGLEYLVIGAVALIVIGPERLPVVLRQLGKWVAKMRGMANEFRASFDEMARQSELDELRKEVDALRRGQGLVRLGDEADTAFKDIRAELDKPVIASPLAPVALNAAEFPEPAMTPLPTAETPGSAPEPKPSRRRAAAKPKTAADAVAGGAEKPRQADKAATAASRPRAPRKGKVTP